jgi:hypothetical protein
MRTFAVREPCCGRRPAVRWAPPATHVSTRAAAVLALQQSRGNATVARAIERQRTLARTPARRRGEPIEQPGEGYDGLRGGEGVPRNLTEQMKEEVRRFRGELEMSMKAKDQSKWGRWAAEDAAAFRGTAAERATLYAEFQRQMVQVDRNWIANVARGTDGSHVFLSSQQVKRSVVIAPDGTVYTGDWSGLQPAADGRVAVDYAPMRKVAPRGMTPPVGSTHGAGGGGTAPPDAPPTSDPSKIAKPPSGTTTTTAPEPPGRVGPPTPTAEPPVVKPTPPPTPGTTVETLAPGQVTDDFVRNIATTSDAVVLRSGRYVIIGRSLYAVMIVGGVAFLVYDIAMRGPIYALRDFGIAATLTEYIGLRAGVGLGMAGLVVGLVFLPSDQGGESERQAKAEQIDQLVESAFPGTLGDKQFLCVGDECSGSHRKILDHDRYRQVWPKVAALLEHPFELDDSPRARAVVRERKEQEERERRQHEEHEKEMAAIREAMHPPVGFYVKGSVGEDGRNDPADVGKTARRLRELGFLEKETTDPDEVAEAIYVYQSAVLRWSKPDGRLDPRGETERALRAGRRISMALH